MVHRETELAWSCFHSVPLSTVVGGSVRSWSAATRHGIYRLELHVGRIQYFAFKKNSLTFCEIKRIFEKLEIFC